MMNEVVTSLNYPVIYVADPKHPSMVVPEFDRRIDWWAGNPTRLAIKVRVYVDGDVRLLFGVGVGPKDASHRFSHIHELETPSRTIAVLTVEGEVLASADVPGRRTRVRVSVNSKDHADLIEISVDPSGAPGRQGK